MARYPIYQCVFMKRLAAVVVVALALVGCANDRQFDECAEDGSCSAGTVCIGGIRGAARCHPACDPTDEGADETCRAALGEDRAECASHGACVIRCRYGSSECPDGTPESCTKSPDCPDELPLCNGACTN